VSKTLEYAFGDWCIAQMAARLERLEDRRFFETRAGFYRNVFDASTGFMRPRLVDGSWKAPFSPRDPQRAGRDYTSGNAWQYTWSVMHDVRGLMGSWRPEAFVRKLDELFDQPPIIEGEAVPPDAAGLIGHTPTATGPATRRLSLRLRRRAVEVAGRVRQIASTLYGTGPEASAAARAAARCPRGTCSARWVLSGQPRRGRVRHRRAAGGEAAIDLGGQRTFTIEAPGLSPADKYVTGATLNGKPLDRAWVSHATSPPAARCV